MTWQTIPNGLLDILIAGLVKKFSLKYSGMITSYTGEAGPEAYYGAATKTLVLIFKGNPMSEYAVVQNATEPDADSEVGNYAEKYGDILASFSSVNHESFQKKAAGSEWDNIGNGFSFYHYIPNVNMMSAYSIGTAQNYTTQWEYNDDSHKYHCYIDFMEPPGENPIIIRLPEIGLSPIQIATAKTILPLLSISEEPNIQNCSFVTSVTVKNNLNESQTVQLSQNNVPVEINIPNISKISISYILTPNIGAEFIQFSFRVDLVYVRLGI